MAKRIDVSKEIGKKYGRYTVLDSERVGKRRRLNLVCKCDCGNIRSVAYNNLRTGHSKSCGCHMIEVITEYHKKHGDTQKNSEHFYLYYTWSRIKNRIFNTNMTGYKDYGGRGITMYEPWINNYLAFKTWILENIGERKDGESIDRINVDENYVPGNLRWADNVIQANNKRNSIKESDILGKKFGRLEIISIARTDKHGHKIVLCKCECGKLKEILYNSIQSGDSKSCGCLLKELMQKKILEIKKRKSTP